MIEEKILLPILDYYMNAPFEFIQKERIDNNNAAEQLEQKVREYLAKKELQSPIDIKIVE